MRKIVGWSLIGFMAVFTFVWMTSLLCLCFPRSWGLYILPLEWYSSSFEYYWLIHTTTLVVVINGITGKGIDWVGEKFLDMRDDE